MNPTVETVAPVTRAAPVAHRLRRASRAGRDTRVFAVDHDDDAMTPKMPPRPEAGDADARRRRCPPRAASCRSMRAWPSRLRARRRSSCRRGRRLGARAEGERHRLAAILLALVQDDGLRERRRAARLERELVRAGVDRHRAAVDVIGRELAVDRHPDRGEVMARPVLDGEDDRRRRGVHLVDAMHALLAHLGGAARRRAHGKLRSREPQLVLRAQLERTLRGHQAVADRRGIRRRAPAAP